MRQGLTPEYDFTAQVASSLRHCVCCARAHYKRPLPAAHVFTMPRRLPLSMTRPPISALHFRCPPPPPPTHLRLHTSAYTPRRSPRACPRHDERPPRASQFVLTVDDLFLHYLATSALRLELVQSWGVECLAVASCEAPLREILHSGRKGGAKHAQLFSVQQQGNADAGAPQIVGACLQAGPEHDGRLNGVAMKSLLSARWPPD